jgi:hypothetical protein
MEKEISFNVRGEDIRTHADSVFIPVDVYDGDVFLLKHDVALRAEFYNELRTLEDWVDRLHEICAARVKEFMKSQEQTTKIPILDKLALFGAAPMKIVKQTSVTAEKPKESSS